MTQLEAVLVPAAIRAPMIDRAAIPPLVVIALVTGLVLALEQVVPLRWNLPIYKMLWPAGVFLGLAAYYTIVRPVSMIRETGLYLGLWLFFPVFAAKLSYIATRAGLPLRDPFFAAADAVMGFRWIDWVHFITRHPAIVSLQDFAYDSSFWQPLLTVPVLALWGPRGRNGEFLMAILLALLATIALYTLFPTLGPADFFGFKAQTGAVIQALRSGAEGPFGYFGIIAFPSFHTAMALLYIAAHRGNRFTFLPILALNIAMLTAVPYQGDHYLSDMLAGAVIALLSFAGSRALYRRLNVAQGSPSSGPGMA
jgi:hypothetical protein